MRAILRVLILLSVAGAALPASAEPYLALRSGLRCSSCHLNVTGGGGRTAYGSGYGRNSLPWAKLAGWAGAFDGAIGERLRLGADLRGGYEVSLRREARNLEEFELSGAQLYASAEIVPDRVLLYLDERVAPGGALNREAFVLLRPGKGGLWVKAGRFFPSYGLRLLDDEAATRKYTGFNFDGSDTGVEVGAEPGPWTLSGSVSNGAGGAGETNNGKQVALSALFVRSAGRIGASFSSNDLPADARRRAAGVLGGARLGPITAMGEYDRVTEEPPGGGAGIDGETAHVELGWLVVSGLTLRAWAGRYDPDRDLQDDERDQTGLGADWTVAPGVQLRAFYRHRRGPAGAPEGRDGQGILELHAYF